SEVDELSPADTHARVLRALENPLADAGPAQARELGRDPPDQRLVPGHQALKSNCTPSRSAVARSKASLAVTASWDATPFDLKRVISLREVRPGFFPASTSPSSATTCSRPMRPSSIGIRISPSSANTASRESPTTRLRATVSLSISRAFGVCVP